MDPRHTHSGAAAFAHGAGEGFVLVGAHPCDVAFRAAEVLRIGRIAEFPGLELVALSTALGMGPETKGLAATFCDAAESNAEQDRAEQNRAGQNSAAADAAEPAVLLVGHGDERLGIVTSGRISLIAPGQLKSLAVPALLSTHESVVGLLAKAEAPTAVVVSVPRLFTAWKGSS